MSTYALCINGPFAKKLIKVSFSLGTHLRLMLPPPSAEELLKNLDVPPSFQDKTVIYSKVPYAEFTYPNSGIIVSTMSVNESTNLQDVIRIMSKDFVINDIVAQNEHS